jgi:uncharacterized membrane protein YqiK
MAKFKDVLELVFNFVIGAVLIMAIITGGVLWFKYILIPIIRF